MPPKPRRKGPAHQNTFAFKHNPNSKLTNKIMAAPNTHVCRRCHDKIEWRKQYRKYKPRTQPGKCNECQGKYRVTAAYHTICESCTRVSPKAKQLLEEWNHKPQPNNSPDAHGESDTAAAAAGEGENAVSSTPSGDTKDGESRQMHNEANTAGWKEAISDNQQNHAEQQDENNNNENKEDVAKDEENDNEYDDDAEAGDDDGGAQQHPQRRVYRRICAVCAKEPALPDEDEDENNVSDMDDKSTSRLKELDRPLKLREKKRLERQAEKKKPARRRPQHEIQQQQRDNDDNDDDDGNDDASEDNNEPATVDDDNEDDSDEVDPFLQAVGGADQLLVGEAYQAKLLQLQLQQQQQEDA